MSDPAKAQLPMFNGLKPAELVAVIEAGVEIREVAQVHVVRAGFKPDPGVDLMERAMMFGLIVTIGVRSLMMGVSRMDECERVCALLKASCEAMPVEAAVDRLWKTGAKQ